MARKHRRRAANVNVCEIEGCPGGRGPLTLGLCRACYQSLRYHHNLGLAHCAEWTKRVKRFAARANYHRQSGRFAAAKRRRAA
jgi:hypothetical protein